MNNLELPTNFDKYSTIIKYYKNNGIDCLSTKTEKFRFYIVHIYSKKKLNLHSSFYKELDRKTNLLYRKERYWGDWDNPDIDSYHGYNINTFKFYMSGFNLGFKITEKFLYGELLLVSDNEIKNYFNDLHSYGKLSIIEQKYDYITITNKFNEAKIVVQKELFRKYCGYQKILDDYNIETFSIDILFNDKVANDISSLLNEEQQDVTHYNFDELEQKFNVVDFLQINLNYDDIK